VTATVELWADGSGRTKGPIGFAWSLAHLATGVVLDGQAGALEGTNNRAELLAVISGLKALKRSTSVEVVTDSQYVCHAYPRGWVASWKRKNWVKVKNADLWHELDKLVSQHEVGWRWTRGHVGTPLNEACDKRAGQCRRAINDALAAGTPIDELEFDVIDWQRDEQLPLGA
jgi:ribonuclease HI